MTSFDQAAGRHQAREYARCGTFEIENVWSRKRRRQQATSVQTAQGEKISSCAWASLNQRMETPILHLDSTFIMSRTEDGRANHRVIMKGSTDM